MIYRSKHIFFFLGMILIGTGFIGRNASFEVYAGEQKPIFSSIKSKANVRTGPGRAYPIIVTHPRPQPVEIIAEAEKGSWNQIKDCSGTIGWVHARMLSNGKKRKAIVTQDTILYRTTNLQRPIARVERDVLVELNHCDGQHCSVSHDKTVGYIPQSHLCGVGKNEVIQ